MSEFRKLGRMRVVLDTNVLISATQWPSSAARKAVRRMYIDGTGMFVSADILEEFGEVLLRDFGYNEEQAGVIISRVLGLVHVIGTTSGPPIVPEDPDDDKIVHCAVACDADAILTYDRHLLKLKRYGKTRIVKPEEMMAIR